MRTPKTDQTAWLYRLIRVFEGCTMLFWRFCRAQCHVFAMFFSSLGVHLLRCCRTMLSSRDSLEWSPLKQGLISQKLNWHSCLGGRRSRHSTWHWIIIRRYECRSIHLYFKVQEKIVLRNPGEGACYPTLVPMLEQKSDEKRYYFPELGSAQRCHHLG